MSEASVVGVLEKAECDLVRSGTRWRGTTHEQKEECECKAEYKGPGEVCIVHDMGVDPGGGVEDSQ